MRRARTRSVATESALDASVIVPGQGAAFRDKTYPILTADLFAAVIAQVHSALDGGVMSVDNVGTAVNVDAFAARDEPGSKAPSAAFKSLVSALARQAYQESLDGIAR